MAMSKLTKRTKKRNKKPIKGGGQRKKVKTRKKRGGATPGELAMNLGQETVDTVKSAGEEGISGAKDAAAAAERGAANVTVITKDMLRSSENRITDNTNLRNAVADKDGKVSKDNSTIIREERERLQKSRIFDNMRFSIFMMPIFVVGGALSAISLPIAITLMATWAIEHIFNGTLTSYQNKNQINSRFAEELMRYMFSFISKEEMGKDKELLEKMETEVKKYDNEAAWVEYYNKGLMDSVQFNIKVKRPDNYVIRIPKSEYQGEGGGIRPDMQKQFLKEFKTHLKCVIKSQEDLPKGRITDKKDMVLLPTSYMNTLNKGPIIQQ